MIDALCIGHAAWDISVWVPGYPAENSKCEIHAMVECSGGPAANAACLLSKWGISAGFVGALGIDSPGDKIEASLKQFGVDTSLIHRSPDWPTPVSVITINEANGSRTIVNRSLGSDRHGPISLAGADSWRPRLLLFDGHEVDASLEALTRWPEAHSILDGGSVRDGSIELARRVKCLAASERFAAQLLGLPSLRDSERWPIAIAELYRLNGSPVVITLGERGLLAGTASEWTHLESFPARPVDTTGAGDIFHGALAYAFLQGMEWSARLRLASAAGALATESRGSSTSIPSLDSVQERLHSHALPN